MIILTIKTDKPEAEIGLYEDDKQLVHKKWQAHRQLAETILTNIDDALHENKKKLQDLQGIVVFQGPGSFTGLRIGVSVANALAYSYEIPIIGTTGDDWQKIGIQVLIAGKGKKNIIPQYGSAAHITLPSK